LSRLSLGVLALGMVMLLAVVGDSILPPSNPAAAINPYNFPFTIGKPVAPMPWNPSTWDVAVHVRNGYQNGGLDPMMAAHGANCSAPPADHAVATYQDAVFLCNNHVMTAMNAGGYGAIYLTPDHMFDWSQGTASLTFPVSTFRTSDRDWIDLWITPFSDNLELPLESWLPDLQGPPKEALHIRMNEFNTGTIFTAETYSNFQSSGIVGNWYTTLESVMTPSTTIRSTFELDLSQSHIRFGIPVLPTGGSMYWIDTALNLPFTRGVVQLGHHSYTPDKSNGCGPPVEQVALSLGCAPNTWHWGGLSMSSAVAFSLTRANNRVISAATGTSTAFPLTATAGSFLRFDGIGTLSVSFDGGHTWSAPQTQQESKHALDHFENYWTPVPAGTSSVMFRGQDWYGGPWLARDMAIWSQNAGGGTPVVAPPTQAPGPGAPPPVATPPASTPPPAPKPLLIAGGINAEPSMRPTRYVGPNPDGWWCQPPNCYQNANPMITIQSEMALAARLGVANVRAEFPWALIEPQRGVFDWTRADAIVAAANAQKVQLQPVLVFSPSWAAGSLSGAPSAADFQAFVKAIVGRYHTSIHVWEMWNEPDHSAYWSAGEASYVTSIVIPGYAGVKSVDPSARVILAGPSAWSNSWFDSVFSNGGGSSFDIVAYHDYGASPQQTAFAVQAAEAQHGGKWPIWLGEYGVQEGAVSDTQQQALMTAVLTSSAPIAMAQWYNLRNDFSMTCCPPQVAVTGSWGLVMHDDSTMKNGFATMQALLSGRGVPAPSPTAAPPPPATAPPSPSGSPEHPPTPTPIPSPTPGVTPPAASPTPSPKR
jgi:hypothetical protein